MKEVTAYVGLGSNLGDRRAALEGAIRALGALPGIRVTAVSRVHETDPVGGPPQGRFLNAVAELRTTLDARALMDALGEIEVRFGRERTERWGPRTLDLDLLLYGEEVIDSPGLTVPHPRMHQRRFVLEPLCEVAPEARHPVLGRSARELLNVLEEG